MPSSRRRRPVQAGRRSALLDALPPLRWWWIVPGLVVFLIVFLQVREHTREPKTADSFPREDIAAARLRIMPYRQSGLIFSWDDQGSTVFVTGSMWEALPKDTQRDLGQAMAVAKDVKLIRILDPMSNSTIATCTAAGQCHEGPPDADDPGARSLPKDRD